MALWHSRNDCHSAILRLQTKQSFGGAEWRCGRRFANATAPFCAFKRNNRSKAQNGAVAFATRLPHGSLLIMAGQTQKNFKHEVPKEPDITEPRINLTFRYIQHN